MEHTHREVENYILANASARQGCLAECVSYNWLLCHFETHWARKLSFKNPFFFVFIVDGSMTLYNGCFMWERQTYITLLKSECFDNNHNIVVIFFSQRQCSLFFGASFHHTSSSLCFEFVSSRKSNFKNLVHDVFVCRAAWDSKTKDFAHKTHSIATMLPSKCKLGRHIKACIHSDSHNSSTWSSWKMGD